MKSDLIPDPSTRHGEPSGTWLSGEEVETLRPIFKAWLHLAGPESSIADRILAACPEPEQFSDEECAAFRNAMQPTGVVGKFAGIEWGRKRLTELAAAGLYVTEAPR